MPIDRGVLLIRYNEVATILVWLATDIMQRTPKAIHRRDNQPTAAALQQQLMLLN